jgi:hypothetical protein
MMDKTFTLRLTGAKLNTLGSMIELAKRSLDELALDVQTQANDQLAREQAAAAMAEKQAEEAATEQPQASVDKAAGQSEASDE